MNAAAMATRIAATREKEMMMTSFGSLLCLFFVGEEGDGALTLGVNNAAKVGSY